MKSLTGVTNSLETDERLKEFVRQARMSIAHFEAVQKSLRRVSDSIALNASTAILAKTKLQSCQKPNLSSLEIFRKNLAKTKFTFPEKKKGH